MFNELVLLEVMAYFLEEDLIYQNEIGYFKSKIKS